MKKSAHISYSLVIFVVKEMMNTLAFILYHGETDGDLQSHKQDF